MRPTVSSAALALLSILAASALATPTDPANFAETTFINNANISLPTGIAWAPDGSNRLFVIRKAGEVRVVYYNPATRTGSLDPAFGAAVPAAWATITPVFTNSECGLIGVCFDPDFINNRYVYFFVTVSASEQQIIRYTDDPGTATGLNKTTLVAGLPTLGVNHDGGGVGIGPDGRLYWSIGDNGNNTGVDANLTSLAAKVGRANRLTGAVLNDNPFFDGAGTNNDYIWARGLRNPFTLTFRPGAGELWVNGVGSSNLGGTSPVSGPGFEQVFIVNRGSHAGWNDWENNQPEGFLTPVIAYPTNLFTLNLAANGATRSGGIATYTTASANPFRPGVPVTVLSVSNSTFNGPFTVLSRLSSTQFTVAQPGADATSTAGTVGSPNSLDLVADGAARSGGIVTFTTIGTHPFRAGANVRVFNVANPGFNGSYFVASRLSDTQFTVAQAGPDEVSGGGNVITLHIGGSITGGAFYDSTAFPAGYHGNFFFGDVNTGSYARATLAGSAATSVSLFVTGSGTQVDTCVGPDGALYLAQHSNNRILRVATTSTAQNIIVRPTAFDVVEGGSAVFTVRLAAAPAGNVNVAVAKTSGDADLNISAGASLTFTPANWNLPQTVTIAAAEDADYDNDSALFQVSSAGLTSYEVAVNGIDNDEPTLVVSTANLGIAEGGSGSFTVQLTTPPASPVGVAVARASGDADVNVTGGAALNFDSGNYNVAQTVTISAAEDAGSAPDAAVISITLSGEPVRTVNVTATDNELVAPAFTTTPIATAVLNQPWSYDANATGNPQPAFAAPTRPSGMQINTSTGLLTWTPAATGNFNVVMQATNGVAPMATQSFTLVVSADAPPTASLTSPISGAIVSGANAEFFGDGIDDAGTVKGEFLVDGVVRSTDINSDGHYHYGGTHALFDTTQFTNGPHTLAFRVTDGGGQTGSVQVQITIANGADAWRAEKFNLGNPADLAASALNVDADFDGLLNLYEYATGSAPKSPGLERLPVGQIVNVSGNDYLALQFVMARWATDVTFLVEANGDLGALWTQIDPANPTYRVSAQENVPSFGLTTVVVRDIVPMGAGPRFMRLRVTK